MGKALRIRDELLLRTWADDTDDLDRERLIALIERVGKGRFAQALAPHVSDETCPDYIRHAFEHIHDAMRWRDWSGERDWR